MKTTYPDKKLNNLSTHKTFCGKNCAIVFLNAKLLSLSLTILTLTFMPCDVLGQAASSIVNTGAPPAWVDLPASEAVGNVPTDQSPHGEIFTLFDEQVNAATSETFVHIEKEITSEDAVQNGANLAFPYDPSFQALILHQITIHRGAQNIDRLDPSKFKIIQQETDLNRQIYNGTLSALLFLEDVRVGDRIEYSYGNADLIQLSWI